MKQYIPKSALVAEIERKINEVNPDNIEDWRYSLYRERDIGVMKNILSLIDTLEVKEVDIDKEIGKFFGEDDWKAGAFEKEQRDMIKFAEHFFKLGLNAQKDVPVSEDLEEAAKNYMRSQNPPIWGLYYGFKAGAQWQKEQMVVL